MSETSVDMVNHPPHYAGHPSGAECIEITSHMGFCDGNAFKYVFRAGQKGDKLEDLRKAVWYLEFEKERARDFVPTGRPLILPLARYVEWAMGQGSKEDRGRAGVLMSIWAREYADAAQQISLWISELESGAVYA